MRSRRARAITTSPSSVPVKSTVLRTFPIVAQMATLIRRLTMLFARLWSTAQTAPSDVLALETYYVTDGKQQQATTCNKPQHATRLVLATVSVTGETIGDAAQVGASRVRARAAAAADTLRGHAEAFRCRRANFARVTRLRADIWQGFGQHRARCPNGCPATDTSQSFHLQGLARGLNTLGRDEAAASITSPTHRASKFAFPRRGAPGPGHCPDHCGSAAAPASAANGRARPGAGCGGRYRAVGGRRIGLQAVQRRTPSAHLWQGWRRQASQSTKCGQHRCGTCGRIMSTHSRLLSRA